MTEYGWTKSLQIARLRADPSGVQDAGTVLQASLLSGMSTITPNVRYISLFTAVQFWRHDAVQRGNKIMGYRQLLRRFEALIALSSVLHHESPNEVPTGVVGRTFANSEVTQRTLKLNTGVKIPPYNVYRGTLGDLELFNLAIPDDPLFHHAIPIGKAWDIKTAGWLSDQIKVGSLPATVNRGSLENIAESFCVCKVPENSKEQSSLVNLLFRLDNPVIEPIFESQYLDVEGIRVASWRLLLEIVENSSNRVMSYHYLMARILEKDLINLPIKRALKNVLYLWRWIATRSLFELGGTSAFQQSFDIVRSNPDGIKHIELVDLIAKQYSDEFGHEKLAQLSREAEDNYESGEWIAEKFDNPTFRNCILLMLCGSALSGKDLNRSKLKILTYIDSERDIPFSLERKRINNGITNNTFASAYWSETAGNSLVQHTRIALRKMAQGNPDTQHVEFEDGFWKVPPGRQSWDPRLSSGFSRLDIALGWLNQLGITTVQSNGSYSLTEYGRRVVRLWDKAYQLWE